MGMENGTGVNAAASTLVGCAPRDSSAFGFRTSELETELAWLNGVEDLQDLDRI